jgi:hypothetical protein
MRLSSTYTRRTKYTENTIQIELALKEEEGETISPVIMHDADMPAVLTMWL